MNASTLFPQPRPILLYRLRPDRGNNAPTSDRSTVFAAIAEAAYRVNASTRYVWRDIYQSLIVKLTAGRAAHHDDQQPESDNHSADQWCDPMRMSFRRPPVYEKTNGQA